MKHLANVVRGALAAVVLAVLVLGTPLLLLTTVANPWPGRSALELRDERAVVTGVLGALIWVVWLRFSITVGVELSRQVRWVRDVRAANRTSAAFLRPVRVEPLPAAGGGLAIAAQRLIATVLLLIPLMTKIPRAAEAAPPLPAMAPADPSGDLADVEVTPAPVGSPAGARYSDDDTEITVAPTDTLRSLATEHLGNPSRWREIFDLNAERVQVDGRRLATPSALRVGWQLKLPADGLIARSGAAASAVVRVQADPEAAEKYRVEDGDNFWLIAERHMTEQLGRAATDADVQRYWLRLIDANRSRLATADPNLIYPGQHFVLPEVGSPASPAERADRERATPGPTDARSGDDERPDRGDQRSQDRRNGDERQRDGEPGRRQPERADRPSGDTGRSEKPGAETPELADASPPAPAPPSSGEPTPSTSSTTPDSSPIRPDAGGDVPPATGPDSPVPVGIGIAALSAGVLAVLEVLRRHRLRTARVLSRLPARPPGVVNTERRLRSVGGVERSVRLDLAVRSAAASMVSGDRRLCALIVDGDGAISMITDGPVSLCGPWGSISPTSDRWALPASVTIEALAATARPIGAPCPALVVVGMTTSGSEVYADPESLGVLYVDADAATADTVVSGIAAALASSALAEAVKLIGVGVDSSCFLGSANHQIVESVDEALEAANDLLGSCSTVESTFRLRARRTGGEEWQPVVVVVGASRADALRLEQRPGLAWIVAGAPQAHHRGLTLAAGADAWRLEPFGIALTPLGVQPEELLEINELLEFEREPGDPEPSDRASPVETDVTSESGASTPTIGPGRPDDDDSRTADASTNGEAPSSSAPTVSTNEPQRDLMIRLFGLVDVVSNEGVIANFAKSKSLELLAWIGAHRGSATRTGARSALWEVDVRDATFANIVSEARRATTRLCQPPDGEDWIARTLNANLVLHERIVTDADVIGVLLDRARQQAPSDAIESLRSSVELIRGVPFADCDYLWPDAEGLTSRLIVLAMSCCSELAELLLDRHDIEGVFWATGQGLKVLPGHEELIAYRMRAHAWAGDRAGVRHEWEAYERVLLGDPWSDGEPAPKLVRLRQELLSAAAQTSGADVALT